MPQELESPESIFELARLVRAHRRQYGKKMQGLQYERFLTQEREVLEAERAAVNSLRDAPDPEAAAVVRQWEAMQHVEAGKAMQAEAEDALREMSEAEQRQRMGQDLASLESRQMEARAKTAATLDVQPPGPAAPAAPLNPFTPEGGSAPVTGASPQAPGGGVLYGR